MARRPSTPTPSHHQGIPRTHSAAKRLNAQPAKVTYNDLTPARKSQFMKFSDSGARAGSICGVGPSNDPNMVLICYKNEQGVCNWVEWPKGKPAPSHD
jgi:hypothetical protein